MINIYEKPLRDYMEAQELTQKQLAEKVGTTQVKISNIINGYQEPTPELLNSITEKTGIEFKDLPEPMETVPIEQAAYELGMSVECLKACLRERVFNYQFGVAPEGHARYIIWRDKLDRFKAM